MRGARTAGTADRRTARRATAALLFATTAAEDGGPAALLDLPGETPVERLVAQLESLGVSGLTIVTRPEWVAALEQAGGPGVSVAASADRAGDLRLAAEIAEAGEGTLVVAGANLVLHRSALAGLLSDPRSGSSALVGADARPGAYPLRTRRTRVVSAASPYHRVSRPSGWFLDVVRVAGADRPLLAEAARRLASVAPGTEAGTTAFLLVGLVRSETGVLVADARDFVATSPSSSADAAAAAARLASADEDRLALDAAVKKDDAFFATFFASPYSKHLARLAARLGLTPNAVTLVSLALGLAAAALYAVGSRPWLVAGAVLLQASFTIDCVDGQLARYTHTYSNLGAWLDVVFDRTKEILVYAALAIGSLRGFDDDVWLLAAVALTLLTVRHLGDFSYVAAERQAASTVPPPPLEEPGDGGPPPAARLRPEAGRIGRLLATARRSGAPKWLHRIVRFPVGERLALISIVTAVSTPRAALTAYVVWASVAGIYTVAARTAKGHARTGRMVRAMLG